jgi:hypothetical protein
MAIFDFLKATQNDLLNKQLKELAKAEVLKSLKSDYRSQTAALRMNAIAARMSAQNTYNESLIARSDVLKQTEIAKSNINLQIANAGFDVNTGTAETLKLQQGLEGEIKSSQVFEQGVIAANALSSQARDLNLKSKELKQQYSFFSSMFS